MYSSPSVVSKGSSVFSEVLIPIRSTDDAARAGFDVAWAIVEIAIEDAIKVLRVTGIALAFENSRALFSWAERDLPPLGAMPWFG